MKYTLEELSKLPTLSIDQAENLKIETSNIRVWLSRCSVTDGEPYNNKVSVEKLVDGTWQTIEEYPAD